MLHNLQFGWYSEGKPVWVDEIFPEDVKELLMLDSDTKSCYEEESNQYQEMDRTKMKMILKKKVTIMALTMTKRKIVTMIVTFFKIKSLIKTSTV